MSEDIIGKTIKRYKEFGDCFILLFEDNSMLRVGPDPDYSVSGCDLTYHPNCNNSLNDYEKMQLGLILEEEYTYRIKQRAIAREQAQKEQEAEQLFKLAEKFGLVIHEGELVRND